MSFLDIKGLNFSYSSENQVLRNINLGLQKEQFLALVGESGSGKTTLLRLIFGLEQPATGTLLFNGQAIEGPERNLVPGDKRMELVYQNYNLFPKHTVEDNILHALRKFSDPEARQKMEDYLQACGLQGLEKRLPAELSGGQQQRVALAKALASAPELLLLDEPFSNLDGIIKQDMQQLILKLCRQQKTTVIMATHDASDALSLSDKVLVLRHGKAVQEGNPEQVYHRPHNEYVARYFGFANVLSLGKVYQELNIAFPSTFLEQHSFETKVCLRAEKIRITTPSRARFYGVVRSVQFYGLYYKIGIAVNGKIKLDLFTTKDDLRRGDELPLHISADEVVLLQKD